MSMKGLLLLFIAVALVCTAAACAAEIQPEQDPNPNVHRIMIDDYQGVEDFSIVMSSETHVHSTHYRGKYKSGEGYEFYKLERGEKLHERVFKLHNVDGEYYKFKIVAYYLDGTRSETENVMFVDYSNYYYNVESNTLTQCDEF